MTSGIEHCTNAQTAAGNCSTNELFRYGGFWECGAACNNGKEFCSGPGCFCIYPGSCYNQPWVVPEAVVPSAIALHNGLGKLSRDSGEHWRLESVFLGISYLLLTRWDEMCHFAALHRLRWPLPAQIGVAVHEWQDAVQARGIIELFPGEYSVPGFVALCLALQLQ